MTHIDLFSGIGGFALVAQEVWGDEYENICFCDNNKFCQEVIKKNFGKGSLIYGDIKEVTRERIITDTHGGRPQKPGTREQTEQKGWQNIGRGDIEIDILTGGFPCQPFSAAGQRRGKTDNRYLWPEMLRIITELKPYWIIGENVAGLVSMAQRQGIPVVESETDNAEEDNDNPGADGILCEIIESIESIGYDVQAFIIPAVAVGAPHRRDRIWVVAHTRHRDGQRPEDYGKLKRQIFNKKNAVKPERPNSDGRKELIGDTPGIRWDKRVGDREGRHVQNTPIGKIAEDKQERNRWECGTCAGDSDAPDTSDKGLEGCGGKRKRFLGLKDRTRCDERREWGKNWLEVATELCRMDDGLPVELDGFKLTKAGHRVERLKALGNAIVPQVVFEIMNAIKNIELDKNGFKM